MRARTLGAAIALAVLVVAARARADAASDAKDLFDRARELRASGDCAGALPLFHKAYEIYPNALGSLRNAAECEESTGRWASARRSWLDLKRALMLTHDAKYEGWEADTDAAAQRLAPRVSHLTVDVSTGGRGNEGLEVTINGEALPLTLVGTRLDRDPGKYVVRAKLGDGEPAQQSTDLVTGESRAVHLVVAPVGQPLPPQPKPKPREVSGVSPWTIGGAVTLSFGAGALVGMGVAIAVRQDALSTFTAQCPSYTSCPASLKPTYDRGVAASTATTVLAIAGGVATAAGVIMLVASSVSSHREHAVALRISPMGASLEGTF